MRNVILAVLAGVAALACGSGEIRKDTSTNTRGNGAGSGDGTVTPGSRIVALSYHGADGSKAFAGLFDKQLQRECAFERLGSIAVCVPNDVYTVNAEILHDSHNTNSPGLYLDPKCSEVKAIALDDTAECTGYGVIRVTGTRYASDRPGCGAFAYGSGLAVVTPIPSGTKVYAYGQGGGQCCSCAEWVPPASGTYRAYAFDGFVDESKTSGIKLVTGTIDDPTKL